MAKEKNKEAYKINNPDLPNDPVARFNYLCFLSKVNKELYLNSANNTARESVSTGLGKAYADTLNAYSGINQSQSKFDKAWKTLQDSIDSYIKNGDLASESRLTLLRNAATGFLGMNSSLRKDTLRSIISEPFAPNGLTVHDSPKHPQPIGLGGIVLTRTAENQPTTQKKVKCPS